MGVRGVEPDESGGAAPRIWSWSVSDDAPEHLEGSELVRFSPTNGTLEVRDDGIVITYEARDGSRWQATYDGPIED